MTGTVKLTESQRRVLQYLSQVCDYEMPPTPSEISRALGHVSYWAAGKIASLERRDLVTRLGTTFSGANCYAINAAGRAALANEDATR